MEPPERITLRYCQRCGATDRFEMDLISDEHHRGDGVVCVGPVRTAIYVFEGLTGQRPVVDPGTARGEQ